MAFLDWLTTPVATAASGLMGFLGQQETNVASEAAAQRQMDFQERLSNSAYQRQVKDLESAGLNPMLAYVKGGGASTPTGAMPTYSSAAQAGVQAALGTAQTRATSAQEAKTKAEIPQVEALVDKTKQEFENLKTDNEKSKALIDNIRQEYQNLMKTNLNLTEVGNHLRESISLMKAQIPNFQALTVSNQFQSQLIDFEQQLRKLDLDAAKKFDNFGREAKQYQPLIDLLKHIFPSPRGGITINR